MPNRKTIAQYLGNGRGSFRKALISSLLRKHSEEDAFDQAIQYFGNECIYCGDSKSRLQVDLLWPEYKGGTIKKGNVVPACPTCNSDRQAKEWRMWIVNSIRITSIYNLSLIHI